MNKSIIYLLSLSMMSLGFATKADQHTVQSPSTSGFESPSTTKVAEVAKTTEPQHTAAITKALESFAPGLKADSIKPIAAPRFYEVTFGAEVVYISQDGLYMLQGDLVDIERRINLTEHVRGTGRLKLIEALDESEMIVFAPEKVKYTVTVFTDIDCPYCRKLHDEMAAYNELGISIRYLAYPRAGIGSKSYDKIVAAWCSKDPKAAMTLAKAGKKIKKEIEDCKDPVREHMELVRVLGVTGTPALIFEDGTLIPGYVPAERLITLLEENKQQHQ